MVQRLTVGEARAHAGGGDGVALLGVDQLADGGQLVHLAVGGGLRPIRLLGRHGGPGRDTLPVSRFLWMTFV